MHPTPSNGDADKASRASGTPPDTNDGGLSSCWAAWCGCLSWISIGGRIGGGGDPGGPDEDNHRFYDLQVAQQRVCVKVFPAS